MTVFPISSPVEEHSLLRQCAHDSCTQLGLYSAPYERSDLTKRLWLCLRHVRIYNAGWNYYAGLSYEEVEQEVRREVVGYRPTWPMGGAGRREPSQRARAKDTGGERCEAVRAKLYPQTPAQHSACRLLELRTPLEESAVKTRYLQLAKALHPDKNRDTAWRKQREERLKSVTAAYRTLLVLWRVRDAQSL